MLPEIGAGGAVAFLLVHMILKYLQKDRTVAAKERVETLQIVSRSEAKIDHLSNMVSGLQALSEIHRRDIIRLSSRITELEKTSNGAM